MSECASQDVKHLRLTFASLGAVHVGEQDVVVVCPVEPLVGVIDSESSGAIDPCVNDNRLPSAIHANTTNVRRFAAVCPEHVPESEVQHSSKSYVLQQASIIGITNIKANPSLFSLKLWKQSLRALRWTQLMIICLPCLGVQSEIPGVFETRTDQDSRVEAIGFGHFQCFLFGITPVQIFSNPIHCQSAGHRCFVDDLITQREEDQSRYRRLCISRDNCLNSSMGAFKEQISCEKKDAISAKLALS